MYRIMKVGRKWFVDFGGNLYGPYRTKKEARVQGPLDFSTPKGVVVLVGEAGLSKTPKRGPGRPRRGTKIIKARGEVWNHLSAGIPQRNPS